MKTAERFVGFEEMRQRKDVFDNTWMLAVALSVSSIVVFWYLGLGQIDVVPIVWTLAALASLQYVANVCAEKSDSLERLQTFAMCSQVAGICGMGIAWHFFGGLQQPMFPLFIMLPLFTGALILSFWQQQLALLSFLGVLLSGVVLSSDTNSFIEERYGLGILSTHVLPAWLPRSRVAFADVSTSPTYNLALTGSLAILAVALTATSRAIIALSWRLLDRIRILQGDVERAQKLNGQLVSHAPTAEVLVTASTGRIVQASKAFDRAFGLRADAAGEFFLDTIAFAYPVVIKRLMTVGGEEIQGATVDGRQIILRVRAGILESDKSPLVRISVEECDEICWRGAVDSIEQPVFAVNSAGQVIFLNRSAIAVLGTTEEMAGAAELFDPRSGMARWWDIAPLESARRVLYRGGRRYLAVIIRRRIAESIGEFAFVHLHEQEVAHALAAS